MRKPASGRLFGVGVGPGDPELLTLKALRAIQGADVVACAAKRSERGIARTSAEPYLVSSQELLTFHYPITTERDAAGKEYQRALAAFYDSAASVIASRLERGLQFAFLCEGDPFLYGSYIHIHERLAGRFPCTVIPGVPSFCAAAAAAGRPLVRGKQRLLIAPATARQEQLESALRCAEAGVVLKLGRTLPRARRALAGAGSAHRAIYVERASHPGERVLPLAELGSVRPPYMSLLLLPGTAPRDGKDHARVGAGAAMRAGRPQTATAGSLSVIGIGPGAPEWVTPEAHAQLACAQHLLGYAPYLERVHVRPDQRCQPSDNRDELERARQALALARAGKRVALISSGDPGIFAMASALCEELERDPRQEAIDLRIVPGISAMQAAAARVGAPLGHDFCVISLSDNLKPFSVIETRLRAALRADLVLCLYNPASSTRRKQLRAARQLLLKERAEMTPVVRARALGSDQEEVEVTTLGALEEADIDMRTLLIVGSSRTRLISRRGAPPLVYTPRHYRSEPALPSAHTAAR